YGSRRILQRLRYYIDQCGSATAKRSSEGRGKFCGSFNAPTWNTVCPGHGGMVGCTKIHGEVTGAIARPLAGFDPAIALIGEHEHRDRDAQPGNGLQLSSGESEAAVTHDCEYRTAGSANGCACCGRQCIPESSMCPIGEEVPTWLAKFVVRRNIGTRRTRIADQHCLRRR